MAETYEKTGLFEEVKNRYNEAHEARNNFRMTDGSVDTEKKAEEAIFYGAKLGKLALGIAAFPFVAVIKGASVTLPIVWEALVQFAHIPAVVISKIVHRDSPYDGKKINKFGNKLGAVTEGIFSGTATVVQKTI